MTLMEDFIFCADNLVSYYADLKEKNIISFTVHSLEARKIELASLWAEVKQAYATCVRDTEQPLGAENLAAVKSKYTLSTETYVSCLEFILAAASKLKTDTSALDEQIQVAQGVSEVLDEVKALSAQSNSSMKTAFSLPPCDSEVFHGDYLSWPSFRDMFSAVYIKHSRLSPVQKLFHLRAKTRDEAHNLVSKYPLTDASFPLAWAALKEQYENTRTLVNNQLRLLFQLPTIANETHQSIRRLHREVDDCLSALKSYGIDTATWDSFLTFFVSNRLPESTLALWESSLKDQAEIPKWADMSNFLTARYKVLESVSDMRPLTKEKPVAKLSSTSNRRVRTHHTKLSSQSCITCQQNHSIRVCPKFLAMSVQQRFDTVQENNICSNCLATHHTITKCKSQFTCHHCKRRHHTLLHRQDNLDATSSSSSSNPPLNASAPQFQIQSTLPTTSANAKSFFSTSSKRILLATAIVSIRSQDSSHTLRALIDPGSEVTLISKAAYHRLGLPSTPIQAHISGVNSAITTVSKLLCQFTISSSLDQFEFPVQALVVDNPTGMLPTHSIENIHLMEFNGLQLADPQFHKSARVDLLLGADLYPHIMREGLHRNRLGNLVAQRTIFGWIISGPLSTNPAPLSGTFVAHFNQLNLDEQVKRFWELEEVATPKSRSYEDELCENLYAQSTSRQSDGRYVVKLCFKPEFPKSLVLGASRSICERRFMWSEHRLNKNSSLNQEYNNVIHEYLELNHMKRVPSYELIEDHQFMSYYLPHHAVVKPDSLTTKLRVVFNASNPSQNGNSINDVLLTGPSLQKDLVTLILRWRTHRFVFNADITQMYRQIRVHESHTPFQRILFRMSPNQPIEDHELLTLTFGFNCSPYLAIRTLHQLAIDEGDKYPLGAEMLREEFYVDDLLSGADSRKKALQAQSEIISILATAGFVLRKWTANDPVLLRALPKENVLDEQLLDLNDHSSVKTLGLFWNAKSDTFAFKIKSIPYDEACTKRDVFSEIAKIFDPAGWTAPIVIRAKILMQQIWKDKTQWKERLKPSSLAAWESFTKTLPEISKLKVPRWLGTSPQNYLEIHGFCDASEQAYAAAVYVRAKDGNGQVTCHLLCAKTKVAPVNTVTLPRLELCGALLLSKLIKTVRPIFGKEDLPIHLWTDASIVIAWLSKPPCTWQTFVANRTSQIQSNAGGIQWKHVPSGENPADIATRGLAPSELFDNSLWWHGPSWLNKSNEFWPRSTPSRVDEADLESKPLKTLHTQSCILSDLLERFSSYGRALKVICYVFRFFQNTHPQLKSKFQHSSLDIQRAEICFIKERLIVMSQRIYFSRDYERLAKGQPLSRVSKLLTLNPMLDSKGVLRVNGRLTNSSLSWAERFPVILPYESHYAKLLVKFVHEISLHGGNQLMLALIRQEYWIPRMKNLIKACVNNCKVCVIHKKHLRTQLMGALPAGRSNFSKPFSKTGVDFAGPFDIKTITGRGCRLTKGYTCIFVCFCTKAIHLEGTTDLSTASFLAAFHRFIARRGLPHDVYSDNGTNFIGADRLIKDDFKKCLKEATTKFSSLHNLTWHFIPPGAPHMGGLWEAGVKSFKTHFKKTAFGSKYTFEEFSTLLCRIEATLNSRPLTAVSEAPSDYFALTPGHFLIGSPLLSLSEPPAHDSTSSLRNRWEKLKLLQQTFCKRWKEEYLKEMHKRNKWKFPQRDIQIGDIVVVRKENLAPTEWRLGRITKTFPGADGKVRVATIKTQRGEITRPIVKLVVLPVE